MKVNTYNQCTGYWLMRGVCFKIGADWNNYPDWDICASMMTNTDFIPFLATLEGVLTYELQKRNVEFDDRSESTRIRFFVVWKSEGYKKFRAFVHLIEYDELLDWNRITLEEYYQRYANQFSIYTDPIRNTWLLDDGTVLMTRLELDFTQRDGVLGITVSEGSKDDHTRRSEWFSPEM
jgi:hypothetical protein